MNTSASTTRATIAARRRSSFEKSSWNFATGQFDYAGKFPQRRRIERLGLAKRSATAPTLAEFGRQWIDERLNAGRITEATAYDYRLLLSAHILKSSLAEMRLDEIHDGHITALIGELRTRPGFTRVRRWDLEGST